MDDISFFLPTRKGSMRVKNKNTRTFAGVEGGLLALKLHQLVQSTRLSEIILSTNDEKCIEIAEQFSDPRLKVIPRPEDLCLDSTPLVELIKYVPRIVNREHIIWGHVTTPFIDGAEYDNIVEAYFEGLSNGLDSLITVKELQNFLISPNSGEIINADKTGAGRWPRTQDLDMIYEVNHAAFVTSKSIYERDEDRIGKHKKFFVQDSIQSFDVDWEDDFLIAEAIYKQRISE